MQNDQKPPQDSNDPVVDEVAAINENAVLAQKLMSWTAPEFIEHKKTIVWYLWLLVVIIVISLGLYLIEKNIFYIVIVSIMGICVAVIAGRSPRNQEYDLGDSGFWVNKRFSRYSEFKSFSIEDETVLGSIVFNPFKRFSFPTKIYFDLKEQDNILRLLSNYLPNEEPIDEPLDKLMRKVRF